VTMNATIRGIIARAWGVKPAERPTFDEIWSELAAIEFQVTAKVDSKRVKGFVLVSGG